MKPLLVGLVVANLLLFGWLRGWMAPLGGDGREPARLQRQVEPDRLKPVPAPRPAGAKADDARADAGRAEGARGGRGDASPGADERAGRDGPSTPESSGTLLASLRAARCAELGPLTEADAMRVQAVLDAIRDDLTFAIRRLDETTSWWVYLAPSPVDAAKRVADLRGRGVTDTYVMPDGPWRGAISLGLFRQEDLAVALQRSIAARGVKGVRVAPRGPGAGRLTMQVRPVPEPVAAELVKLRTGTPEAAPRPCPAA